MKLLAYTKAKEWKEKEWLLPTRHVKVLVYILKISQLSKSTHFDNLDEKWLKCLFLQ